MKKGSLMFTGCAMLLSAASTSYSGPMPYPGPMPPPPHPAPYHGPLYLSVNGGLAMLNDMEIGDPSYVEVESDPGLALTGALGYNVCHFFRLEAEVAYQKNEVNKASFFGESYDVSGDTNSLAGLVNGYVDFANPGPVTPFISAGIGAAKVEASIEGESDDSTACAYQIGAGLNVAFNHAISLDLKYRYFATVDLEIDETEFDYSSHNIYGGLRFAF